MDKIPCSIAIITSKADGLEPRLKALSEFGEVVICHGNAPEENLAAARNLGAKVIRQYDSDEPLLNSITDKAAVRQVAMDASTLPWRFFMDRDDSLSPETIEEIRAITTQQNPMHLVWRMPGRIYLEQKGGTHKEIKYDAAYPAYQTRLVHQSVGAKFKGLVHERLEFDRKKFSVGTMQSHYNFHWPHQRVENYWKYLKGYADREVAVTEFTTFSNFLYWHIYRRLRTVGGYLYRVPLMYLRHGFTDSTPLWIELEIIGYNLRILFGSLWRYLSTRPLVLFCIGIFQGRSFEQTRVYLAARRFEAYGRYLDINATTYLPAMRRNRWHKRTEGTIAHLSVAQAPDWKENYFDTEMVFELSGTAGFDRLYKALRPQGKLIGSFVGPEVELNLALERAGFKNIHMFPVRGTRTTYVFQAVK